MTGASTWFDCADIHVQHGHAIGGAVTNNGSTMNSQAADSTRNIALNTALFLGLFFSFQLIYQSSRDTRIEDLLINEMTVAPSVLVISLLTPEEGVSAQGHRLVSSHIRMSVLNGCEGTEVILLLCAALLAFRMSWRHKLLGIALGSLLVYAANQARIVSLYYCLRFDRSLFEALHGYIAPIAVVAVAVLFFIYWISHAGPNRVN
jgi:exosortase family protein XrtM